ncbi:alpha/beta hydrolase [Stappia indica]|uniref:alpha/beta hydrolase n=1 Tax=Stappia indica TaxID=538381 RepID=UPI00082DD7A1|nr:alpha/beta hydrolase-fold protein [Stappia indica]
MPPPALRSLIVPCLAALVAAGTPARASGPYVVPARIEGAVEIAFTAKASGEDFRLLVFRPEGKAPAGGWPVLYSFDGEDSFALLTDIARTLNGLAARTGRSPVAVAAIAWPRGRASVARRVYDMTPPTARADGVHVMPERPNGQPWPRLGGGEAFLALIEDEVKPLVRSVLGESTGPQTLFGHSLGGLMVLHRLATDPGSFACYAASSPSIWVDDRQILADLDRLLARPPAASADAPVPGLRVTVGSAEEEFGPQDARAGEGVEARRRWIASNAMVTNARALAALLAEKGEGHLRFVYEEYEGRTHQTSRILAALDAVQLAIDCTE